MQIPQIPRLFRVISGLMVALALLAGSVAWWLGQSLVPAAGPNQDPNAIALELVVPKGSSAQAVGLLLEDAGLPIGSTAFAWTARLLGQHRSLQAGVYGLTPGLSLYDLIDKMARGDALQDTVTFVEGWRFQRSWRPCTVTRCHGQPARRSRQGPGCADSGSGSGEHQHRGLDLSEHLSVHAGQQ